MAGDAEESGGKYKKENENSFRFLCVPIVTFYGYLVNGRERGEMRKILFFSLQQHRLRLSNLSRLDGIKKVDEGNNNNGMEKVWIYMEEKTAEREEEKKQYN